MDLFICIAICPHTFLGKNTSNISCARCLWPSLGRCADKYAGTFKLCSILACIGLLIEQEASEKYWAHSPLRAAACPNFTLPFTRCRYCRTPPLSHAACASMSTTMTTTTTTTRDRGDRYGPIKWT